RRRHTRSLRDWSSDVCSSDLTAARLFPLPEYVTRILVRVRLEFIDHGHAVEAGQRTTPSQVVDGAPPSHSATRVEPADSLSCPRSEERRVGKGGRPWGR